MRIPILLIHGLLNGFIDSSAPRYFSPLATMVPDLLGYGGHVDAPTEEITLPCQADYLAAMIELAGEGRVHVVGHSVGGAIAMLLAARHPDRVASLINVEGNFTLRDAFWSSKFAAMSAGDADNWLVGCRRDPERWLTDQDISPTPARIAVARRMFESQPAATIQAMARSVVDTTSKPDYLAETRTVIDRGMPFHLVAGERSRDGWDVPEFVSRHAASYTVQPGVGHMMMLEDAEGFHALLRGLIPAD